jgi:hypothetical protein
MARSRAGQVRRGEEQEREAAPQRATAQGGEVRAWNVEDCGHQGLRRGWGRRRLVGIAVHRDRGSEREQSSGVE